MFQILSRKKLIAECDRRCNELCWRTSIGDFSDGPTALLREAMRMHHLRRMPRFQVIWVSKNKRKS